MKIALLYCTALAAIALAVGMMFPESYEPQGARASVMMDFGRWPVPMHLRPSKWAKEMPNVCDTVTEAYSAYINKYRYCPLRILRMYTARDSVIFLGEKFHKGEIRYEPVFTKEEIDAAIKFGETSDSAAVATK